MLAAGEIAGFKDEMYLAGDVKTPLNLSPTGEAVALATDDFMHFCRDEQKSFEAMCRYDAALDFIGAQRQAAKDITGAKNATALGIDLTRSAA